MNIIELISNPLFLNEANILNNVDPHDGHSIQKFLKFYANGLATAPGKKMFIKKLSKFLMNDPKYHFAVRELPADAPDWARQAMEDNDLFYFKPDDELKTTVEHLSHYLNAVERDMDQTADNNKKVFATREFQAFPKAVSLELLATKSTDYFKRGVKVEKDTDGMHKVYDVGEYTWYKLEEPSAFAREGKTLQNCIGSYWSHSKAHTQGMSILVMRDAKSNSVVAARIHNQPNQLMEMKGKNNKPPVPMYMPPVASMINKFKLNLSDGANSDIMKAGYYIHEGKLLTKPQAMKIMVQYDDLGDIGYGLKLDTPKYDKDSYTARGFMEDIYGGVKFSASSYRQEQKIYEARENNTPVIIAVVKEETGELLELKTYFDERFHDESTLTEAVDASKKKEYYKAFINKLVSISAIKSISEKPLRHAFWEVGLTWDKDNLVLKDKGTSGEHQTDRKHHKWESYEGRDLAALMDTIPSNMRRGLVNNRKPSVAYVTTVDTPNGRNANKNNTSMVVIVGDDGMHDGDTGSIISVHGDKMHNKGAGHKHEFAEDSWGGYDVHELTRDKKTITSLTALAKEKHFTLPQNVRVRLGILGDTPDQYNIHDPKWEKLTAGDVHGQKMDLSGLRDADRLKALYSVITDDHHGTGNESSRDRLGIHTSHGESIGTGGRYNDDNSSQAGNDYIADIHNKIHGNIDALWKVNVGFGVEKNHGILMVSGKNIIKKIDNDTESHKWQGWDDYQKVADQLNEFAKEHHLIFDKKAVTTDKRSRKEFRVGTSGQLETATAQKKSELSRKKKKEGTDSIKFSDDWTLTRMTPEAQANWARQDLKDSARGTAWLLQDDDGDNKAIIMILHGRPARMFTAGRTAAGEDLPTASIIDKKYFPYLKTAAKEFGWKEANQGAMKVASSKVRPTVLNFMDRVKSWGTEGYQHRDAARTYSSQDMKAARTMGAVKGGREQSYSAYKYKITQLGLDILQKRDDGEEPSVLSATEAKGTHEDWVNPKDAAPTPAAPTPAATTPAAERTPRATPTRRGGGATKASQALDKFRDHVEEHGSIPTRGEFIAYMADDPFNMSKAGAQTYYYTTKKKYANLNESVVGSLAQLLLIEPDLPLSSFSSDIFG